MVWVLAASLVAGILQSRIVLVVALTALLCFVHARHLFRPAAALLALLTLAVYLHGEASIRRSRAEIASVDLLVSTFTGPMWIEGWVADYPQQAYGKTTFEFETVIVNSPHRVLVQATDFGIGYGDSLRLLVQPRKSRRSPTTNSTYLLGRRVSGSFRASRVQRLAGHSGIDVKRVLFWPVHNYLRTSTTRGIGSHAGIPLALLLGERGLVDRKVRDAFVQLGISHLLALSGLHLGFVTLVFIVLTRRLPRAQGHLVLLMLMLYVAVVGFLLSLLRALTMAAVLILARELRRPASPRLALANAFFLMLLLYPSALYAVSFQLSFAATFAVLAIVERLPDPPGAGWWRKTGYWARSSVIVSAGVQAALVPVLLIHFGRVSIAGPLATVVFVVPVIGLLGFSVCASALARVSVPAGDLAYHALQRGAALFDTSVLLAADVAPAPIELDAPNTVMYFGGLTLLWYSGRRRWLRFGSALLFVAAWVPWFRRFDFWCG